MLLDETHDQKRRSWVESADGHPDFPIQNLPLGVFRPKAGDGRPRPGVAIGEHVLCLSTARASGLLGGAGAMVEAAEQDGGLLNRTLAFGPDQRRALRREVSALLAVDSPDRRKAAATVGLIHAQAACDVLLPCRIGDYSDFYAGIHHAVAAGRLFRPDNPLLPNYKHLPIAYHGRASSVVASGTPVRRPLGQRKAPAEAAPTFGPCRNLDFELELGIWIGTGNALGSPVPIGEAGGHIAGFCLLNDWSARDIQSWEYQPLGPFLGKSFATTISPWIVTPEALAPFRIPQERRPDGDPAPLPYLLDAADQGAGALDLELEAWLTTTAMRRAGMKRHRLTLSNARHLYWTVAQMVAHHTSNGCNLQPGDLFGTGTISGPTADGLASLLELTAGGRNAIVLPNGETRTYLQDGDEITLTAHARRDGFAEIGLGSCRGEILPALET